MYPDGEYTCTFIIIYLENVATRKPATQSTTHGPNFEAVKAVDGNKTREISDALISCSHTKADSRKKKAWWQVDLQNVYKVSGISITPRNSGMYCIHICFCIKTRMNSKRILPVSQHWYAGIANNSSYLLHYN